MPAYDSHPWTIAALHTSLIMRSHAILSKNKRTTTTLYGLNTFLWLDRLYEHDIGLNLTRTCSVLWKTSRFGVTSMQLNRTKSASDLDLCHDRHGVQRFWWSGHGIGRCSLTSCTIWCLSESLFSFTAYSRSYRRQPGHYAAVQSTQRSWNSDSLGIPKTVFSLLHHSRKQYW